MSTTGVPPNAAAGWTFTAPAGTSITAATLVRDLYKSDDDTWVLFVSTAPGAPLPGQDCVILPISDHCEVSGTLNLTNLNAPSVSIGVMCPTGCVSGFSAHDVRADLDHAIVTLSDPTPPAPPTASGPLSVQAWHSGTVGLDLSSTDVVGISLAQVRTADGAVLASAAQACDYTYPVPCPQATGLTLPIDTTRLPDGIVPLTLLVADPAQNTKTATINAMVANHPPPPPRLTGAPTGPSTAPAAEITAGLGAGGVPIDTLMWALCAATCPPATAVSVPAGAGRVKFTASAPADGLYTIQAYALDAAGHASSIASVPFDVDRAGVAPSGGGPPARPAARLPAAAGASVKLAPATGSGGVRILLTMRRRPLGRIELDVRTSPRRPGHLRLGLAFAGHHTQRRSLTLRRGAATAAARVPTGATRLTVSLAGLGARSTRDVLLAPAGSA